MATQKTELFLSRTQDAFPRINSRLNGVRTFKVSAGAETLPVGTPVSTDGASNQLVPWSHAGADEEIVGFVFPREVTLDASDEIQGIVCLGGGSEIHFDDIDISVGGASSANLKTELRKARTSYRGFDIQGLDQKA